MLWLYILLGIVLFFAIILAIPIKVCVQYKKQFFCRLRIGFVKIILYPPVPKKKKPKKKKKTEQPQKPAPKKEEKHNDNFLKELGLSGIVNLFTRITELAAGVLKDFFAHIIIKSFALSIKVGGKDAADTAINYGKVCSVVYPLTSAVISSMKYTHYGVDILPDFTKGAETKIEFFAIFKTRIAHLVKIVLKHGFKALKMLMELKNIKDN